MIKKKTYTQKLSLGIDLNDVQINKNSLALSKNMIYENGALKKRKGWKTLCYFKDESYKPLKINGIYEFKRERESFLVVHAGTYMYKCDNDFKNREKIEIQEGITLTSSKSNGFMNNGVMWITGASDLLIYDGERIIRAYESEYAYVPTTKSGAGTMLSGISGKMRSPNMLTARRKNSMSLTDEGLNDKIFSIDTEARENTPFKFKASLRVKREDDRENDITSPYIGVNREGSEVNCVVFAKFATDNLLSDATYTLSDRILDGLGNEVLISNEGTAQDYQKVEWYLDISNFRELMISFNARPPELGKDNIEVEFTADNYSYEDLFKRVSYGQAVTTRLGKSILLLCCGDNKIYYSDASKGFSYFPSDNVISLGDERQSITAIVPMADNFIGVYKENSFYRVKINPEKTGSYEIRAASDGYGCTSPFSAACLGDDALCLNESGVFGISRVGDTTIAVKCLKNRSYPIERAIVGKDTKDAVGCVHRGKYYLFIDDIAYVADSSLKSKHQMGTDSFYYEWLMLENCPCSYAGSINDTLFMGRENGSVAVFYEGYRDKDHLEARGDAGELLVTDYLGYSHLTLSSDIGLEEGDIISLDEHYIFFSTVSYEEKSNCLTVPIGDFFDENEHIRFYEGMEIMVCNSYDRLVGTGTISYVSPSESSIMCNGVTLADGYTYRLYVKKGLNDEYKLYPVENGFFMLYDEKPVRLYSNDLEAVYIKREKSVNAYLAITPKLTDRENGRVNIYGVGVTATKESCGAISVILSSKADYYKKSVAVGNGIDFNRVDFDMLSFEPNMKKSVKIKCYKRNVEHPILRLEIDGKNEFGIESVEIEYSENK